MSEELLERVLREIRERKQAARAAVEESARLERALAALGREPGGPAFTLRSRPRATPVGPRDGASVPPQA
jgi:hypothetical protein